MNKTGIYSVLAALLLTACAAGPQKPASVLGDEYSYAREYLQWMIRDQMAEHDIVGLSIALVDDQRIVWSQGFGFADEGKDIQAGPQTVYRAGSITKLFTATAVMQLVEQGRLDIDHPLREYVPEFQVHTRFEPSSEVTPRLMMTHHSGLPSDIVNGMWGDETASYRDLPELLKDEYLAFEPGQVRAYSNIAFGLLGLLVERVSGLPYNEYVEKRILEPAGMRHAYIGRLRDGGQNAAGYYEQQQRAIPVLREQPAGGLNASVEDLGHFAQLTLRVQSGEVTPVISRAGLKEMQSYQDGHSAFDMAPAFGFAWAIDDSMGEQVGHLVSHNGGTPMFSSQLMTLPEHKLAVVVMSNSNSAGRVTADIARKAMALMLESKTGMVLPENNVTSRNLALSADDLSRLPGSWSSLFGWVDIERDNDSLELSVREDRFSVVRHEDDRLYLEYDLFGLIPLNFAILNRVGAEYRHIGERELIVGYVDGKPRQILAQKIRPHVLPEVWRRRLGAYEVSNAIGAMQLRDVKLVYKDRVLRLDAVLDVTPGEVEAMRFPLDPVREDVAFVQGIGRQMGGALRAVSIDGRDHLVYSGFVFRPAD